MSPLKQSPFRVGITSRRAFLASLGAVGVGGIAAPRLWAELVVARAQPQVPGPPHKALDRTVLRAKHPWVG